MSAGAIGLRPPQNSPTDENFPVALAAAGSHVRRTRGTQAELSEQEKSEVVRHKRVRWSKPKGARRPGVIDAMRCELVRCLEQRQGSCWTRIKYQVHVAGYTIERAGERVRAFRSDGAESLLATVLALLYMTDVRTGFVGKPRAGGGQWQRYTLRDIAQLAYGSQGEGDIRRASRAIAAMISLGWTYPTKQVRRHTGDATFRSEAGVRRLNLKRICDMTGTTWLLQRDRRHADQKHGTNTASIEEGRAKLQARQKRLQENRAQIERLEAELKEGRPQSAAGPPRAGGGGGTPVLLRHVFGSSPD